MNKKLIELYFQIEKEFNNPSEKEGKQIEAFIVRLIEENEKITPSNQLRNSMLAKFKDERITPLLKNSYAKKSVNFGIEREYLQPILKILEKFLGDELVQVKRIIKEIQLKKIAEKYVE